ncbi:metallo-beta-lactamase [Streptomyces eurocidicus]|uniref:Glyoxylase-like metal-dependent hydrolase (Beta-lactamase superfamily II) n=1 Tax=Streptomyces eurocidicus TaxID=66423 RepID=A0A2N8NR28_STREU|nr:MBL fold metallo-hydrolase [Streptomyces eurocidicus]MBB5116999.1 glyoxylase-like metal-dependent hydrolase (beta-lactamase superfamily II) [Streptomyces eurocidicus]MBF6052700.1 MBL fold metallo-hydrolase [Streptomyces eurocidicus]PNE31217.1 metallo-beta-lactamase [Streptomyces eurocidicus]
MDERLRRPAGIHTLRLGGTKLTYLPDGAGQLTPGWLPDVSEETWAAHPEYLDATGNLVASMGGLLVERDGRALLIDAGLGPQEIPAEPGNAHGRLYGGALLDSLAKAGRAPGDIEAVAFTHLHLDHLGWACLPVPGTDRPAFPAAEYLVAEPEWTRRHLAEEHGTSKEMLAALEPRVRTVADGEEIFPGVRVMLTPGHTAGHAAYVITDGGRRLIAFGDALHSPIQVDHPEWSAVVDHDPVRSAEFRHRLVEELARPDTTGFGLHFADVVFGRVERGGDGPAWRPVTS